MIKDSHRRRLYRAERAAFGYVNDVPQFHSQRQAEDAVRELESLPAFQRAYPSHVALEVKTRQARNGGHHYAPHYVKFSIPKLELWIVCHEVAHAVTPWVFPAHGVEFVQNFLHLVEMRMGRENSDLLKASFETNKVPTAHGAKTAATTRTRIRCSNIPVDKRWMYGLERDEMEQGRKWMTLIDTAGARYSGFVFLDEAKDEAIVRSVERIAASGTGRTSAPTEFRVAVADIAYIK